MYSVTSTATVIHVAQVWAEDESAAIRQAEDHVRVMAKMKEQSGAGYNANIERMWAHPYAINSYASEDRHGE